MKNATDVERRTNVIPLSFKDRRSEVDVEPDSATPNEISHPASKRFEALDDTLSEFLPESEFLDVKLDLSSLIDEDYDENYIFHHQKSWDFEVSRMDSPKTMADTVLKQIKRLKEDSKRIKYYLQELNLDE